MLRATSLTLAAIATLAAAGQSAELARDDSVGIDLSNIGEAFMT